MDFRQDERTCLFIDGANLYSASRNLGFDVDYRSMLAYFKSRVQPGSSLLLRSGRRYR